MYLRKGSGRALASEPESQPFMTEEMEDVALVNQ